MGSNAARAILYLRTVDANLEVLLSSKGEHDNTSAKRNRDNEMVCIRDHANRIQDQTFIIFQSLWRLSRRSRSVIRPGIGMTYEPESAESGVSTARSSRGDWPFPSIPLLRDSAERSTYNPSGPLPADN